MLCRVITFSFLLCVALAMASGEAFAQYTRRAFEFVNLPATARTAGLGGVNITQGYGRPGAAMENPALLAPRAAGHLSANYMGLVAGIRQGTAGYAVLRADSGVWHVSVRYLDYGDFEGYDPAGQPTGTFQASDYAVTAAYSHQSGPFRAGLALSLLRSSIAGEGATGLALDIGGVFQHPEQDLTAGLVFRNAGVIISDYSGADSRMPFDVQAGLSFRPAFMPFRFSITAHNLLVDNLVYVESEGERPPFTESIFRRLVFGTQIGLGKSVILRAGYNHLLRKELRLEQAGGGAGFAYGIEVRAGLFTLAYSHLGYHAAGGGDHISLTANMQTLAGKLF
ncbi:type IX secretion system protein PorQ [Roseivirga sp. BDSF3-8]|uniref:type IX secretion system protein PorQ n=1 Tax=Roseivirga sp. BDSF3-8 TaxID=3241598 RepID=UPI00353253F8